MHCIGLPYIVSLPCVTIWGIRRPGVTENEIHETAKEMPLGKSVALARVPWLVLP